MYLDFTREATDYSEAVASAMQNIAKVGFHGTISMKGTLELEVRDKDGNVVRREQVEQAPPPD